MAEHNSNVSFLERMANINTYEASLQLLEEMNKNLKGVCIRAGHGEEIYGLKEVLDKYKEVARKTEEFAVKDKKEEDPKFIQVKENYAFNTRDLF